MTDLIYDEIGPISKTDAINVFASGDSRRVVMALLSAAYYIKDWRWVQDNCLRFLNDPDLDVRNVAVTCLSHIARIHGTLEKEKVIPVLNGLVKDPQIGEEVAYTLEEIEWFLTCPKD